MNYKFVSSKQVIQKVIRDLKPDTVTPADMIEWIGEALEFIGVGSAMAHIPADIEIDSHRGHLPCDIHMIAGVEYQGLPMVYGSDPRMHALSEDPNAITNPYALSGVRTFFAATPWCSDQEGPDPNTKFSFSQTSSDPGHRHYYVIEDGKITTSIESGTIRVHYMGIKVDCDNLPMIPDNATTKEAIFWYILRQMIMGGYKHPVFSWNFADAKWESYCGKAQNDLMFPSIDKMESFREMWVNLIPQVDLYNTFFSDK